MRLIFDHGTLVLAEPPDTDLSSLPGVRWDPRVALFRAPAYRYPEVVEALKQRRVSFADQTGAGAQPDALWSVPDLRPYQQGALLSWQVADGRGLVIMPTGSGKTRVGLAAIASLRCSTLCLVPTRALLQQWLPALARIHGGQVGCLGDGQHTIESVTVATFESAYRNMARIGARFELLIVDEAHHFGVGVRDEALEMCTASRRLGLTATPPSDLALRRLHELVGPVVYQLQVGDLRGTFLADFDTVTIRLALDAEEKRAFTADRALFSEVNRQFRALHPNGSWQDFVSIASQSPEGRRALQAWQRNRRLAAFTRAKQRAVGMLLKRHASSKVLIFTADNAAAYAIARAELVMPITCHISHAERQRALAAFQRGDLKALVSARVLNEGIDVPDAEVAIIVGATQGEREHVQRVGRLLRPVPGKRAVVYELITAGSGEVRRAAERRRGLAPSNAA